MNTTTDPAGDVCVIVPAAGSSERMGAGTRKPFLPVGGQPLLLRTCRRLARAPGVFEVIAVVHPADLDMLQNDMWEEAEAAGITLAVAGGSCRAQTVWNGLEVMSARAEYVAVHDAARPFFPMDTFRALLSVARKKSAAVPLVPVSDTPKRIEGDRIISTERRAGLMRAQTPQVFASDLLIEAYEYAMRTGGLSDRITDDAMLVEQLGKPVYAVLSDERNLKITTPHDLRLAEAMLAAGMVEDV